VDVECEPAGGFAVQRTDRGRHRERKFVRQREPLGLAGADALVLCDDVFDGITAAVGGRLFEHHPEVSPGFDVPLPEHRGARVGHRVPVDGQPDQRVVEVVDDRVVLRHAPR